MNRSIFTRFRLAIPLAALGLVLLSTAAFTLQDPEPPFGACVIEDAAFVTANGGCMDIATGLTWSAESKAYYTEDIRYLYGEWYCRDLVEGGYSDWRMPTLAELQTVGQHGSLDHLKFWVSRYGTFGQVPIWSSTFGTKKYSKLIWAYTHATAESRMFTPGSHNSFQCVR